MAKEKETVDPDREIDFQQFSKKHRDRMMQAGFKTDRDLLEKSIRDLLLLENFDRKIVNRITEYLIRRGYDDRKN